MRADWPKSAHNPSSYETFEDFAHEFQAVLSEESSWKMDAY